MANIDGLPVNSAVTHAEFMSRTEDTSTTGKVDFNNTTDSTAPTDGSIHTAGGLGVEKSLNVGLNASVSGELIVGGETTLNDTLNASNIIAADVSANTLLASGNIVSSSGNISGGNFSAAGTITSLVSVAAPQINAGDIDATGDVSAATINTTGNVTVGGNLIVNGTTTTVNSTNVSTVDKNITINQGGNDASSEGSGFTVDRTGTDGSLIYKDASATKWAAGSLGSEVDLVGTTSTQTLTNKTISGASNTITNISLTTGVTGVLPVSNGGTGQSTYSVGDLLYASATNVLSNLSPGTAGHLLTSNGAGVAPSYQAPPSAAYTTKFVYARHTTGQAYTANQTATLVYNSELEDPSNLYNNTTGTFTADENGFYVCFATAALTTTLGTQQTIALMSLFNGSVAGIGYYNTETTGGGTPTRQCQLLSAGRLTTGQTIVVQFINNGQSNSITTTAEHNVLIIYKVGS